MISIAEDDVGELLLVYQTPENDFVVMDGNRRTSALKVLLNPDLAPSESIRKRAIALSEKHEIKSTGVLAQVSTDKVAILRTIYERHGSGGKSRLTWPAMAKSRFGYDHDMDIPESEWKVIALLYKLEDIDSNLTEFLESNQYKHDVFRRIVPAAIKNGVISPNIFSDRDKKIKKSEPKLVQAAYETCLVFFDDIKNNVIGLKRTPDNIYASADGVIEYLERFVPENKQGGTVEPEPSDETDANQNSNQEESNTQKDNSNDNDVDDSASNTNDANNGSSSGSSNTQSNNGTNNGVNKSRELEIAILRTNSEKFEQLYKSICTVSLVQHPSLVILGSWALVESIASGLGKDTGTSIDSFFSRNNIQAWWPDHFNRVKTNEFRDSLEFIRREANGIKHAPSYHSNSAVNLKVHFECLDELLIKSLEKITSNNS